MSATLKQLQDELKARLESDAYFSDLNVVSLSQADFASAIEQAVADLTPKAGKIGAFVVVGVGSQPLDGVDTAGPLFGAIQIAIIATENPLLNNDAATGTGKAAFEICKEAARVLHHYRPEGLAETIYVDPAGVTPAPAPSDAHVSYRLPVRIPDNWSPAAKVAMPVLSADVATPCTVTMTCSTSSATIYYTTDESYPASGNTHATLYTAPLSLSKAATIRAVAYKSGMTPSDSALGIYS